MNLNTTPERSDVPDVDSSTTRQVDWLFLDAGAARATLDAMPFDAPVLLVKLAGLDRGGMATADWEATLARSLLSKIRPAVVPEVLRGPANLEVQPSARLAFCGGVELHLTSTEFALLQELLERDGAVASVDGLSRAIWGHETLGAPNYVEAHISRLRRKLRDVGAGRVIETVRGAGYRIRQPHPMSSSLRSRPEMRAPSMGSMYDRQDAA
jgi:DNA-binding response OmpR family regulator